jgi:hypothetical protein
LRAWCERRRRVRPWLCRNGGIMGSHPFAKDRFERAQTPAEQGGKGRERGLEGQDALAGASAEDGGVRTEHWAQ